MNSIIGNKMKKNLQFISGTCVMLFMSLNTAYGQQGTTFDKLIDFLPPAPNAASIVKYGDASVNKNTGTPNINIPLFTVKGTKLSTSVSIGYSSNGIKVDDIASRVGMGWAINAGGVITRTQRGVTDETNTRHYPYATIGFNWSTINYLKRITESAPNNGYDAEPDVFSFSFDGYSGSFVYDGENYILVNKNGIKVDDNFTYNASWNFKLTTPDGNVYIFGGPSATEKTKRNQSCGKSYNNYVPTAWYLKEIQHPNGETITFTYTPHSYSYDNGVSQTMYYPGLVDNGSGCSCYPISTTTCVNTTSTTGVLLSSIESPGNAKVDFTYISRGDCDDKLISGITLKDPVNTVSSFNFTYTTVTSSSNYINQYSYGYDKTPYLTTLTENSSDNSLNKKHYFSYLDPQDRPTRLSFSQDHWGYFNGKINTSFTPDLGLIYHSAFPSATANREPDFAYSKKGLLQKIVYPTGGITTLFYEPNVCDFNYNSFTTTHKLSCDVTGTGQWVEQTKTKRFNIANSQYVQIQIECRDNSGNGNFDPIHNKGFVQILYPNNGAVVFNGGPYSPGDIKTVTVFLAGNSDYDLVIKAAGTVVTTLATLIYESGYQTPVSTAKMVGGARVQKILTNNLNEAPMIKRYYYGTLEDLNKSSMWDVARPIYTGSMKQVSYNCNPPGIGYWCTYQVLNSSSLFNLGFYNNSTVSYASVVEGIGDNFEGGGTETRFYVGNDGLGQIVLNRDINNSPFTNFSSLYNAKPSKETVVKKMPDGNLKPMQKTEYEYNYDPAGDNSIFGYNIAGYDVLNVGFDSTCNPVYDPSPFSCYSILNGKLGIFDMVKYTVYSSWIYPKIITQTNYDENGENPVVTTTNNFHENVQHLQLTRTESNNSKGQLIKTINKYPHEFSGTQVYDEMITKNIITPLVNSKSEIVNNPGPNTALSEQQVDYANAGNNNYSPVTIKKSVQGNSLEVEGTIDSYDSKGNILQYTSKAGIVTSIIWGYNYKYPVAQIVGATYANCIAQLTGGSVTALQSMDGATLRTELNNIRTNISSARVTSYTYKHLAGVSSITDPNNKTNTYEYDTFNRLMIVKDQEGNAVKKNEYVYATPDPNSGLNIYFNEQRAQYFTCNTCASGYTGSTLTYFVAPGKYYSLASVADANTQADAEIQTYGQEYANRNGYCSNSASCTGTGYKFVSCGCELGQIVCENTQSNGGGSYTVTYHYLWSDGSISSPSTTQTITCTGVDKKMVNCVCETGTKVCDNVTNNGGGSYTVTYHYHWTDNTNSSPITETFNCSGPDKKLINCGCETGEKIYTSSVWDKKGQLGCSQGQWLCTYHYHWSDGSNSADYTECSPTNCMPVEY